MEDLDFNKISKEIYEHAKPRGLHVKEDSREYYMMLVIKDLSAALESQKRVSVSYFLEMKTHKFDSFIYDVYVRNTIEDKLADAVIRLLYYAGMKSIEVDYYKSVVIDFEEKMERKLDAENLYDIIKSIVTIDNTELHIMNIFALAARKEIKLSYFIEEKMKYKKIGRTQNSKSY